MHLILGRRLDKRWLGELVEGPKKNPAHLYSLDFTGYGIKCLKIISFSLFEVSDPEGVKNLFFWGYAFHYQVSSSPQPLLQQELFVFIEKKNSGLSRRKLKVTTGMIPFSFKIPMLFHKKDRMSQKAVHTQSHFLSLLLILYRDVKEIKRQIDDFRTLGKNFVFLECQRSYTPLFRQKTLCPLLCDFWGDEHQMRI